MRFSAALFLPRTFNLRHLAGACLAIAFATNVAWAEEIPGQLRPLAGDELRAAVSGHELAYNPTADGSYLFHERFCPDGGWAMFGTRVPIYGSYTIEEDLVYIRTDYGAEFRRQLFVNAAGEIFLTENAGSGRSIQIERFDVMANC